MVDSAATTAYAWTTSSLIGPTDRLVFFCGCFAVLFFYSLLLF